MRNIAFDKLKERAKELNCIYNVEELLKDYDIDNENLIKKIIDKIPDGWQYPTICEVRIIYENKIFESDNFIKTQWFQNANIIVDNNILGEIQVFYTQFIRLLNNSQFLPEEQKLLNTIANRLGNYFFHKKIKYTLSYMRSLSKNSDNVILSPKSDEYWKWRLKMTNIIAQKLDFDRFGVENFYIIGSTKNANAGPNSDIDLLIHFTGNENQKKELTTWIEGWSLCLSEMNYSKTGYKSDGLIDLHIITDQDIKNKTSFAVMIGSVYNSARLLKTKK